MKSSHIAKQAVVICKAVEFYSTHDETSFFEWAKKLKCVKRIQGVHDEIWLHVHSRSISDRCLRELIVLCFPYKVDMTQLQQFLRASNKHWFGDKRFWLHRSIFARSSKPKV